LEASAIDVMDCLTFVCATENAAYGMKAKQFKKAPTWNVVWSTILPQRKRTVCSISTMLKVLGLCTKPEAALLSSKISSLTAIVVSKSDIAEYSKDSIAKSVDEVVDTSDMHQQNKPTSVVDVPHDTPFYPISVVQGMHYHHAVAFGIPEKTREFMQNTLSSAESIQLARDANKIAREKVISLSIEEEHEHERCKRKRIAMEEKMDMKRTAMEKKMKFLKSMGHDDEYALLLKEYIAL